MSSSRTPRLFVVDDEPIIATTLAEILERAGYLTEAFTDPLKVLKAADARCPDLLISDLMMPGMNGVDLAIAFKEKHPKCRVLIFSGHASTTDLLKVAKAQGHHFDSLSKPVHPKELIAKVREMSRPAQQKP